MNTWIVFMGIFIVILIYYKTTIYNLFVQYASKDDTTALIKLDHHKDLHSLQHHIETIGAELDKTNDYFEPCVKEETCTGDCSRIYLKWYAGIPTIIRNTFTKTTELLSHIKGVETAVIVKLAPYAIVHSRHDQIRGCFRVHIGLNQDHSTHIKIDDRIHNWKYGDIVAFDNTYTHEIRNETDREQLILYLDVRRNMSNWVTNYINQFIIQYIVRPLTTEKYNNNIPRDELDVYMRQFYNI